MRASANHVAVLIRNRRTDLKISQRQLHRKIFSIGKDGQFVSNVERGKCSLPVKHIPAISELLEIDPNELIEAFVKDYRDQIIKAVANESSSINQPSGIIGQ